MMKWDEAFKIIEPFALADIQGEPPWPPIRIAKCKAAFTLASKAKHAIVELGTGRALTLCAMRLATFNDIYSTDIFTNEVGYMQELYGEQDFDAAVEKVRKLGVGANTTIMRMDARELAAYWQNKPTIDLVFWDIYGDRLYEDFMAWEKYIANGGVFAAKVVSTDDFGFNRIAATPGWTRDEEFAEGNVLTVRKQTYADSRPLISMPITTLYKL